MIEVRNVGPASVIIRWCKHERATATVEISVPRGELPKLIGALAAALPAEPDCELQFIATPDRVLIGVPDDHGDVAFGRVGRGQLLSLIERLSNLMPPGDGDDVWVSGSTPAAVCIGFTRARAQPAFAFLDRQRIPALIAQLEPFRAPLLDAPATISPDPDEIAKMIDDAAPMAAWRAAAGVPDDWVVAIQSAIAIRVIRAELDSMPDPDPASLGAIAVLNHIRRIAAAVGG